MQLVHSVVGARTLAQEEILETDRLEFASVWFDLLNDNEITEYFEKIVPIGWRHA